MNDKTLQAVDTNVSDLFFNTDHANAQLFIYERGARVFEGYNAAALLGNATAFCECLSALGVDAPEPEALVDDFMGRQ